MLKTAPIRTAEEQERYSQFTESQLRAHWGDKFDNNIGIIKEFIAAKLTESERMAMETHLNSDGFVIGSDPRYVYRIYELAKIELTEKEKRKGRREWKQKKEKHEKNRSIN